MFRSTTIIRELTLEPRWGLGEAQSHYGRFAEGINALPLEDLKLGSSSQ